MLNYKIRSGFNNPLQLLYQYLFTTTEENNVALDLVSRDIFFYPLTFQHNIYYVQVLVLRKDYVCFQLLPIRYVARR